jgi:hypothetical protein
MTTQIKPIGSGSFQNVNKKDKNSVDKASAPSNLTNLKVGMYLQSLMALNLWFISGGTGEHADTSKKILKASNLQVQEV